jgi:Matrixin
MKLMYFRSLNRNFMNRRIFLFLFYSQIIYFLSSCNKYITPTYKSCDSILGSLCDGKGIGAYCTFGYKWGNNNPFPNAGLEKPGPGTGNIELTYKFVDSGFLFNTHNKENLTSISFEDNTSSCTKDKFRLAFTEWSSVAKVGFREVSVNEKADIKIMVADIEQSSIGYPNYNQSPCLDIKGQIIFKRNEYNCSNIYGAMLHEIGHVLGLGHVNSQNVMHQSQSASYNRLQSGDILGVQSIYGSR